MLTKMVALLTGQIKKEKILVILLLAIFLGANPLEATVLTFNTINNIPIHGGYIPDGYGGFNWNGEFGVINKNYNQGSGYENGTVSGAGLGGNGSFFAMDNFTYVPEPSSIVLLTMGGSILQRHRKYYGRDLS